MTRNLSNGKTEVSIETLPASMSRMAIFFTMVVKLGVVCFEEVFFLSWFFVRTESNMFYVVQSLVCRYKDMTRTQLRHGGGVVAACGRLSTDEFAGPFCSV